jgi:hypothetical protein
MPPTGSTAAVSETSPVIAVSSRTLFPNSKLTRAVVTDTPAGGPSLGKAAAE